MLEIDKVSKTFAGPEGEVKALDDVSLRVEAGEIVAVQGRSGSGKTTLLLAAGGLLSPDAGTVTLDGEGVWDISPDRRALLRGSKIGFVFQQFHLIPYLDVVDNILAPSLAIASADARSRALELCERFGLMQRARHVPAELSVGERQRTAMARALLNRPRLILADEPTGNLDEGNAENLMAHLQEFASGGGAVLLVTHDPLSARYATRALRLESGRIG